MKKIIGIVFADDLEYKPFKEYVEKFGVTQDVVFGYNHLKVNIGEHEVHAIESGIGKVNASLASSILIQTLDVTTILNAGLSGAINNLKREDVVAGTSYIECDFDLRKFGFKLGQKPAGEYEYFPSEELLTYALEVEGVKEAKLGTGDFFLADVDKKDEYYNEFKINAFDMESASIAATCKKLNVPFLSIRKISDDAQDDSVGDYKEMNNKCEATLTEVLVDVINKL